MDAEKLLHEIEENIEAVILQETSEGQRLWQELLEVHPADIASLCTDLSRNQVKRLFLRLPQALKPQLFEAFSDSLRVYSLSFLSEHDKAEVLAALSVDSLSDLFDLISDEQLKECLSLLNKKVRGEVLQLLQFDRESAGGIMDIEVFTLLSDYTVERSIKLLQRLRPSRDIYQHIYVLNHHHQLVGHIKLEDLVLEKPTATISSFMRENEFIALAHEDQEEIAKKMVHYGLMTVPVIDDRNRFLGVIPSETLVDVLVEEASEDAQRLGALTPHKQPYFDMSFLRSFYERGYILVVLFLFSSISTIILQLFEARYGALLLAFVPMLVSAGGNTSAQTSMLVIQGLTSGDLHLSNMFRFMRRECAMAFMLACTLGSISFGRVYLTGGTLWQSFAVSVALALIVMMSVILGSAMPFLLKRFNIDPAFSAGPFLATMIDILGALVYCLVVKVILF